MVMTSSNLSILDEGAVLCRQFYVILNMITIPVFSSCLFPKFNSKKMNLQKEILYLLCLYKLNY